MSKRQSDRKEDIQSAGQADRVTERQNDSMADSRAAKEPALVHFGVEGERWHQGLQSSVGRWTNYRLSAVRQRHLADERYYYWDREYTSLSSVHLPTEFWRPWWRLPRSTSKCKIGFRGLTAETFWFDPNWSILWRVMTLAEMECSQKKTDKPL